MNVVKPATITDLNLFSSTVPEPDTGEIIWVSGTYNLGDRRIKTNTHRVYEVTATPSTTDDPEIGVNAVPPTWVDVSPTNKWAMFDNVNSTSTKEITQLVIEIKDGVVNNSLALFNITGATNINVTVTDPVDGIVYTKNTLLLNNSQVLGWYYYYFSPIITKSDFIALDLPAYPLATIKITIDGQNISIGNFIVGNKLNIGVAKYGTSVQLLTFNRKDVDSFGNTVVKKGRTSKLVSFDVGILKNNVNYVFDTISSITSVPAVWVGAGDTNDPTIVFGYYKDYQNNISSPTITDATITIEGLV